MVNTDFKKNKLVAQENVTNVRRANLNKPEIIIGRYRAYTEIHGDDAFIKNERVQFELSLIRKSLELKTLTVEDAYEAYQHHADTIRADEDLLKEINKYEKDHLSDMFMYAKEEEDFKKLDIAIANYTNRHGIDTWITETHDRSKALYEKMKR